jgi:hypothetical protein
MLKWGYLCCFIGYLANYTTREMMIIQKGSFAKDSVRVLQLKYIRSLLSIVKAHITVFIYGLFRTDMSDIYRFRTVLLSNLCQLNGNRTNAESMQHIRHINRLPRYVICKLLVSGGASWWPSKA